MMRDESKRDDLGSNEILVESHALLGETMAYLARLPPNPLTAQMVRKIRDHLESPTKSIATKRARQTAEIAEHTALRNAVGVHGTGWFLSSGLPALELLVVGSVAKISSPAAENLLSTTAGKSFAADLASRLAKGVEFTLHPYRTAISAPDKPK